MHANNVKSRLAIISDRRAQAKRAARSAARYAQLANHPSDPNAGEWIYRAGLQYRVAHTLISISDDELARVRAANLSPIGSRLLGAFMVSL
jgi:hypothetical protein